MSNEKSEIYIIDESKMSNEIYGNEAEIVMDDPIEKCIYCGAETYVVNIRFPCGNCGKIAEVQIADNDGQQPDKKFCLECAYPDMDKEQIKRIRDQIKR